MTVRESRDERQQMESTFDYLTTLASSFKCTGMLEVVGVTDVLHLASSLGGLSNGLRLCQGKRISVAVPEGGIPLQIDGEPFNVVVTLRAHARLTLARALTKKICPIAHLTRELVWHSLQRNGMAPNHSLLNSSARCQR